MLDGRSLELRTKSNIDTLSAATSIAALFHDVGKLTCVFNFSISQSIDQTCPVTLYGDPLRHEVYSCAFWSALTDGMSDADIIAELADVSPETVMKAHRSAEKMCARAVKRKQAALAGLTCLRDDHGSVLREFVGLMILTHHRATAYDVENGTEYLPKSSHYQNYGNYSSFFDDVKEHGPDAQAAAAPVRLQRAFQLHAPDHDLFAEADFRTQLRGFLEVMSLDSIAMLTMGGSRALCRNALMIADHLGSAAAEPLGRDPGGDPIAKSIKTAGGRQYGDTVWTHTRKVTGNVDAVLRILTEQRQEYPSLSVDRVPESIRSPQPNDNENFAWQHHSARAAAELASSDPGGFFCAIVSDTGRGKTRGGITTLAAACFHDADPANRELRCVVGLPLRTLASQFGKEYDESLGFSRSDIAVIIGDSGGDEDEPDLIAAKDAEAGGPDDRLGSLENQYISQPGGHSEADVALAKASLPPFVQRIVENSQKSDDKVSLFLGKPIVIATLDHLMPITQAETSSHLEAGIRSISSDVLIDEVDLFSHLDISAIARLAYLTGCAGRRFMVTSATARGPVVEQLFQSYRNGYREFAKLYDKPPVVHGLITSHTPDGAFAQPDASSITELYDSCVRSIVDDNAARLERDDGMDLRKIRISEPLSGAQDYEEVAEVIKREAENLHTENHIELIDPDTGGAFRVSAGLVKVTRVNQLVQVLKSFPQDDRNHRASIILHSKMIACVRSRIEGVLADILQRKPHVDYHDRLARFLAEHGVFGDAIERGLEDIQLNVFASPVIETGNDLDFDWAIMDTSSQSMTRSLVQASGRINRHRRELKSEPNIVALSRPLVTLTGQQRLEYPGIQTEIETEDFAMNIQGDPVRTPETFPNMETGTLLGDILEFPFDQTQVLASSPENLSLTAEEDVQTQLFDASPSLREFEDCPAAVVGMNHARLRPFRANDNMTEELFAGPGPTFYKFTDDRQTNQITWLEWPNDPDPLPTLNVIEALYDISEVLRRFEGYESFPLSLRTATKLSFRKQDPSASKVKVERFHPFLGYYVESIGG